MTEKVKKSGGTGFPACVPEDEVSINYRNLPHWRVLGSTYFITFRIKKGILNDYERRIVLDSVKHCHNKRYWVTATVIMPDHVHLLLQLKSCSLSKILQGIKGFSARKINRARDTKGALWLDESYDRIVRDHDEYLEKWNYIRNNAVTAGLCQAPAEYEFLWEPKAYEED